MKTRNTAKSAMALTLAAMMTLSAFPVGAMFEETMVAETAETTMFPQVEAIFEESSTTTSGTSATNDAGLQAAIVLVKTRYEIPESLNKFTFYSGTKSTFEGGYYRLTWQDEKGINVINATVEGELITRFSKSRYEDSSVDRPTFAKLSTAQQVSKAKALIKQLNPTVAAKLFLDENSGGTNINDTNVTFNIKHQEYGFDTPDYAYISINKDTGEISDFYMNYNQLVTYAKPESYITQAQAQKAFAEQIGFKAGYYLSTDYTTGERTAHLFYTMDDEKYLPIDALTGKVIDFYKENSSEPSSAAGDVEAEEAVMADSAADGGVTRKITLTPEELKAIDELSNLITDKEALKKLQDNPYCFADSTFEITRSSVSRDMENQPYYWSLTLESTDGKTRGNATVDAETGRIISFSNYSDPVVIKDGVKTYGKPDTFFDAKFDETAEKAVRSLIGDDSDNYVLQSSYLSQYYTYPEPENKADLIYQGKSYTYIRTLKSYVDSDGKTVEVNLPVYGDTLRIYVGFDGKVTQFSGYQLKDYELPDPSKMVTVEQLIDTIFPDQMKLNIAYATHYSDKQYNSALLYTADYFYADALTGNIVNYDGTPILPAGELYSDIKGTSYETMVNKLAANGVSLPAIEGKLNANEAITESDWLQLVSRLSGNSWDPIFSAEYNKIWSAPDSLRTKISRADAIKLFISAVGGSKFAELTGIYTSPFADVKNDDKNVGYFALANALGALQPDKSGNARPNVAMTRLSALVVAYNYIVSGSK